MGIQGVEQMALHNAIIQAGQSEGGPEPRLNFLGLEIRRWGEHLCLFSIVTQFPIFNL
jgi:hypothetical protein